MFGILFKSIETLIIWIIVGVAAAYSYGYVKPYFNKIKPVICESVQKSAETFELVKNNEIVKNIIKQTTEKSQEIAKNIVSETKVAAPTVKEKNIKKNIQIADNSNLNTSEDELFNRQMNIVNELMN